MADEILRDIVIINEEVLYVVLENITPNDKDGKIFRLKILDNKGNEREEHRREFDLSGDFLAIVNISENDLYNYLIQFRETLPNVINSNSRGIFKYPEWPQNLKIIKVGELLKTYFKIYPGDVINADYLRNSVLIEFGEILQILDFYEGNRIIYRSGGEVDSIKAEAEWLYKLNTLLKDLNEELNKRSEGQQKNH